MQLGVLLLNRMYLLALSPRVRSINPCLTHNWRDFKGTGGSRNKCYVRFEIQAAAAMKSSTFRDIKPCRPRSTDVSEEHIAPLTVQE
jgi:hypothetical protein